MKSNKKTILVLVAVLVVSCCFVSFLASIFIPDADDTSNLSVAERSEQSTEIVDELESTAEPEATFTEQPTYTPQATYTPLPTYTPVPTNNPHHTATSRPTNTPQPTATINIEATAEAESSQATASVEVVLTDSELEYATEVFEISQGYATTLDGLVEQTSMASQDVTVFLDDDWKTVTVIYLAFMMSLNEQVRDIDPPEKFREAHSDLLDAAGYFDLVVVNLSEGIDELNATKINIATTNMNLATEAIVRATEKVEEIADNQ